MNTLQLNSFMDTLFLKHPVLTEEKWELAWLPLLHTPL